jgi:hypothetical protein
MLGDKVREQFFKKITPKVSTEGQTEVAGSRKIFFQRERTACTRLRDVTSGL